MYLIKHKNVHVTSDIQSISDDLDQRQMNTFFFLSYSGVISFSLFLSNCDIFSLNRNILSVHIIFCFVSTIEQYVSD